MGVSSGKTNKEEVLGYILIVWDAVKSIKCKYIVTLIDLGALGISGSR